MRTHTNTHAHARTHTHAQTHRHIRAHTHTHTLTHTHTHSHTHAYACTRCARDGLRQFFSVASNAPTLSVSWFAINSFMCPGCFGS